MYTVNQLHLSGKGLFYASCLLLELSPSTLAVGGLTLGADPLVAGVAMSSW